MPADSPTTRPASRSALDLERLTAIAERDAHTLLPSPILLELLARARESDALSARVREWAREAVCCWLALSNDSSTEAAMREMRGIHDGGGFYPPSIRETCRRLIADAGGWPEVDEADEWIWPDADAGEEGRERE